VNKELSFLCCRDDSEGSDSWAVHQGWISLTPLSLYTDISSFRSNKVGVVWMLGGMCASSFCGKWAGLDGVAVMNLYLHHIVPSLAQRSALQSRKAESRDIEAEMIF
jgi:hypothetical protein